MRYALDAATGRLVPDGQIPKFFFIIPRDLYATSDQRHVYVLDGATSFLNHLSVDPRSGAVRNEGSLALQPGVIEMEPHPSERFLFVLEVAQLRTIALDPVTGEPTDAGEVALPLSASQILVHPTGAFVYALHLTTGPMPDSRLMTFAVAPATGALTPVDADPTTAGLQHVALAPEISKLVVSPDGRTLWQGRSTAVGTWAIDQTTGPPSFVSEESTGEISTVRALAARPDGAAVYGLHSSGALTSFRVDPDTGELTREDAQPATSSLQNTATDSVPDRLAFGPSDLRLLVSHQSSSTFLVFELDPDQAVPLDAATPTRWPARNSVSGTGAFQVVKRDGTSRRQAKWLYGSSGSDVARFRVEADGSLVHEESLGTLGADQLLGDLGGRFLYGVNSTVEGFDVDPDTGALASFGAVENSIRRASLHPSGFSVHAFDLSPTSFNAFNSGFAFELEPLGNWSQAIFGVPDPSGFSLGDVMTHPLGQFVYCSRGPALRAYSLNVNGDVTSPAVDLDPGTAGIQDLPAPVFYRDLLMDPTGRYAYAIEPRSTLSGSEEDLSAFAFDPETGVLVRVDADPGVAGIQYVPVGRIVLDALVDPTGRFVFVANGDPGEVRSYRIEESTGRPIPADTHALGAVVRALACDPGGRWVWAAAASSVVTLEIDPATGALTQVASVPVVPNRTALHAYGQYE